MKPQQLLNGAPLWCTVSVTSRNRCVESHGWFQFVSKCRCVLKMWPFTTEGILQSSVTDLPKVGLKSVNLHGSYSFSIKHIMPQLQLMDSLLGHLTLFGL